MFLMKTCTNCKEQKELAAFNKRRQAYQSICKECNRQKCHDYYALNRERQIKQVYQSKQKRIRENQSRIRDVLAIGCKCGFKDIRALEFHHIYPADKSDGISKLLADGYSWKRLEKELAKCEVICANCHKIETSEAQNWHKSESRLSQPLPQLGGALSDL